VEFRQLDVYDLSAELGTFDIVLFLGVLYHCKHPLLALERIFNVCAGSVYVSSLILPSDLILPRAWGGGRGNIVKFLENDELCNADNWWIPDQATVEGMLRTVGFRNVEKLFHSAEDDPDQLVVSLTKAVR